MTKINVDADFESDSYVDRRMGTGGPNDKTMSLTENKISYHVDVQISHGTSKKPRRKPNSKCKKSSMKNQSHASN